MDPSREIARLLEIMAALRTPQTGCPWDLAQNFSTIAPYTLEEAYEVADAIARGDLADLKDELGDLLLQVVFHARMAQEQGAFDFGDVVQAITEKLIRRHPHVFADETSSTPRAVEGLWERIKAEERQQTKPARLAHSLAFQSRSLLYPALSNYRPKQAKSDLTGTIPARCCEKFARKPTRSKPNSHGQNETKPRLLPKSAICCLPWLISRATLMQIRKRCCGKPM